MPEQPVLSDEELGAAVVADLLRDSAKARGLKKVPPGSCNSARQAVVEFLSRVITHAVFANLHDTLRYQIQLLQNNEIAAPNLNHNLL